MGDPLLSLESVIGIVVSEKTETQPTRFATFINIFSDAEISAATLD